MNGKKILISSVLSLSLLVSGVSVAPAFASTGNTTNSSTVSDVSTLAIVYRDVPNSVNSFANSFKENGVTWYLKSISYSNGTYWGHYEGNQ